MEYAIPRRPTKLMAQFGDLISAIQRHSDECPEMITRLREHFDEDSGWDYFADFIGDKSEDMLSAHRKGRADDGLDALDICERYLASKDWLGAEAILVEFSTSRSDTKVQQAYDKTMKELHNAH